MATNLTRSTTQIEDSINAELATIQDNVEAFGQAVEAVALAAVAGVTATDISVSSEYAPTSINKRVFVANRGYKVVGLTVAIDVAGTDVGAVTVMLEKVPSGTAIGAGTDLLTAAVDLKSAADSTVAGTLVASVPALTLAAGDALALNFGGTNLAAAIGAVTTDLTPV